MKLRLQFRLRTLLAALVVICVSLGGWHLYFVYFGPYVEAGPAIVGQPIKVRGRFMDFLGFDSALFVVSLIKNGADGRPVIHQQGGGSAKRVGLWAYDVEIELPPIRKAGEYDIELCALTKAVHAGKTTMQAHPVRGKKVVVKNAQ